MHIEFLETETAVCETPELLGTDFVKIHAGSGPNCRKCVEILVDFNERQRIW